MSERVTKRGHAPQHRNHYEMRSMNEPTPAQVGAAQGRLGFHMYGYGSPMGIKSTPLVEGGWVTTWTSHATCD